MANIKKIILPSGAEYNFRDDSKVPLSDLLDLVYPVGSIYMSVNNTSPETFLGGEWTRIKDKFLLSAGDTYTGGSSGGSSDAVVVSHTHPVSITSKGMSANASHSHKAPSTNYPNFHTNQRRKQQGIGMSVQ